MLEKSPNNPDLTILILCKNESCTIHGSELDSSPLTVRSGKEKSIYGRWSEPLVHLVDLPAQPYIATCPQRCTLRSALPRPVLSVARRLSTRGC